MKPAARPVHSRPHEFGQNQKAQPGQIHWESAPANPSIINQAGDHERKKADCYPGGLLAPKLSGDRVFAHVGCAVYRHYAENREGQHVCEQEPVQAKQFSQQWCHEASAAEDKRTLGSRKPPSSCAPSTSTVRTCNTLVED